jgi:vitamin B12 transporter
MRKFYVFILTLLGVINAVAQDSAQVTTLREVVISASRSEEALIEVPRSVTVISEAEIRSSIYQSVGDLLNAESGLYIVGTNQTPGTNQNVFLRGANSNQVAVLIDGVRITDPTSPNAAIDFSEISLTNVERIEVLRGSHSTIFGGGAIGGVINIITKKDVTRGFHGDVSWQGGTFGKDAGSSTENADLNYGTNTGIYFNGSVFQQNVSGLNASEAGESISSFTADRDDFRKTDAALKVGFKNDSWDANISFKNSHQYTEIDDGALADDDNSYLTFNRTIFQYYVGRKFSQAFSFSLLGSLSDSRRFYEDDSSRFAPDEWDHVFSTGTYFGKLQTHEAQINYEARAVRGVLGIGVYREKMSFDSYLLLNAPGFRYELTANYDTINPRATTAYVFTQWAYELRNFRFSAGARLSNHSTAGNYTTFELNPSYAINNLLVYGSLSTGFNAPSLYQVYDPARQFSSFTTRGNSALKPETSISIEAGIKKQFTGGSYFTLSAYRTMVNNSIEYVYLWNGSKAVTDLDYSDDRGDTYLNVSEQDVRGIELEGFVQVSPAFSLQGNISMLKAWIHATPDDVNAQQTGGHHVQLYNLGEFLNGDVDQNEVVRRPRMTAFSRLTYRPVPAVSVQVAYRYTGNRYDAGYDGTLGPYGALARIEVEEYHLFDFGVNWNVTKPLSVSAKVENILDEDYREVVGFQTRGRSIYLKLRVRF